MLHWHLHMKPDLSLSKRSSMKLRRMRASQWEENDAARWAGCRDLSAQWSLFRVAPWQLRPLLLQWGS
jgi:hypothetical protein